MNTFFPTWPVDGPPPIPPVHGLIPAASAPAAGVRFVVDTADGPMDLNDLPAEDLPANAGRERWLDGIAVYPYPQDVPETWDACVGGSGQGEKSFGTGLTPPEFNAATISLPITCTAQQVPDEDRFKARAVAVIGATESYAVERELMASGISGQRCLADAFATFPNGGAATRPNHALQILEEAVAATGRLGVIHCSPMLATALLGQGFVIKDTTGVIRTINGIVVIPGFGYVGHSKPDLGAAPGATEEWMYATGPIDIRRSEVFTTPDTLVQALDRSLGATNQRPNTVTYRAERYFVLSWDTALQAAVLVDRCSQTCVVGS